MTTTEKCSHVTMDRKEQHGQALVELGMVVTLFVLVTLGVVEFGYDFLAFHVVTQATSAGARAASLLQHPCGTAGFTSAQQSQIDSLVRSQVGGVATIPTGTSGIAVTETGCGTIPQVTVTVNASIPHLFGLVSSGALSITRTATFRDEGQS